MKINDIFLYIVIKYGVHMKGVWGVFCDVDEAKQHAKLCAEEDEDRYHQWIVLELHNPEVPSSTDPGTIVFSCRKGD